MKTKSHLLHPVLLCLLLLCSSYAMSQTAKAKEDIIYMLSGEEKHGKILEVGTDTYKFVHANETLVYTLKRNDISKISFASGRTEVINAQSKTKDEVIATQAIDPNLVAILPFKYRSLNEGPSQGQGTGQKLQDDAYNYMTKKARIFKFQDPQTTNALLYRNGVDGNTLSGYTYDELCKILGVGYIIHGGLSRSSKDEVQTIQNKSTEVEDNKRNQTNMTNTTVERKYENQVAINIYNQRNERIYTNQRTAFFSSEDSYQDAMRYMLKRCPLYK
ncbi:hypothetical protein KTO58_09440 [Chitinophaga pendula]|uniref:hypothetical protein n=1 Tax=Chitinophaga TaxID=79328 RepID=UPI000BB046EE|nr:MULTISPECIES: hypothetical protein [Chitinophaga]ASZ12982.1 hypothetical protein CK934_19465 [Chitinophaga sp. MD30]UCJ09386.1 hypothetical protein KTO58_09440 [Chitinophaga pendula]